jgi:predicted DNA-binding protein YlxM (UPF0122 family)
MSFIINSLQSAYIYGLLCRPAANGKFNEVPNVNEPVDQLAKFIASTFNAESKGSSVRLTVPENLEVPYQFMSAYIRGALDFAGSFQLKKNDCARWYMRGTEQFLAPISDYFNSKGIRTKVSKTAGASYEILLASKRTITSVLELLFSDEIKTIITSDKHLKNYEEFVADVISKKSDFKEREIKLPSKPLPPGIVPQRLDYKFNTYVVTPGIVDDMKTLYEAGFSFTKIADMYGVTQGFISYTLKENEEFNVRNASEAHRKFEINEDFFDHIDSEEKAYFLGFLWADGCNHLDGNYVSLSQSSKDREILVKLAALIYKDNPEERVVHLERVRESKAKMCVGEEKIEFVDYFTINSQHICKTLNAIGCTPAKSLTCTFPAISDPDLQRHFIRGYFDGDGSINSSQNDKEYSSSFIGTKETMSSIKNIIASGCYVIFGEPTLANDNHGKFDENGEEIKTVNCYRLQLAGNQQIKTFGEWLYRDAKIFMARKKVVFDALSERIDWVKNPQLFLESESKTVLTDDQKAKISEMVHADKTAKQIAVEIGLTKYEVSNSIRRMGLDKTRSQAQRSLDVNDERYFANIDSEEKGYVLGFCLGAASIQERTNCISFEMSNDPKQVLQRIAKSIYKSAENRVKGQSPKKLSIYNRQYIYDIINAGCSPMRDLREIDLTGVFKKSILTGYLDAKLGTSDRASGEVISITGSRNICESIRAYLINEHQVELNEPRQRKDSKILTIDTADQSQVKKLKNIFSL